MIKRILAAIDGSTSADAALSIAGSLAGITGAELIGLFVEDVARITGADAAKIEQEIEAESLRLFQSFQTRCGATNVEGRFLSLRGAPAAVLAERAKTVDFIVMGTGDHQSQKKDGETLISILRNVARPILVVPDDPSGEPKMVVAYDGTLPSDRTLREAAALAEISEMTTLHLLTVSESTERCQAIQAPAVEYLSAYDMHVVPVCATGLPEEAIPLYVEQVDASILAIAAFGPNRMKESVFGSTTQAVLKQAEAAVLLVA